MSKKMLKFVNLNQETPVKRETGSRKKDFNEIYDQYITDKAKEQSSRCSQCGVPFCQIHCPLQNNIPDWLKLTAEGRLKEAYEISQSTNNMPEVCGRICPQDRLCEGNCVIEQSGHGTVTIGSVEKYITDTAWEKGWVKPLKILKELKESIGIIGAGPAGLACAEEMRKYGYKVTVYDRYDRAGGLLIYGIPNFKLEKFVVERRTKLLKDSGIKFVQNFEVGKDKTLEELKSEHDAILIATGVYKAREIDIPGSNLGNIFPAMDFLRTAVRQKAKSVKCLYRRDKENMPGSAREVGNAEEEGVDFVWLTSPKSFIGNKSVNEVEVSKMELGEPDASGRSRPIPITDGQFKIKADLVIKSLGFDPENIPKLFNCESLVVSKWGTIKIDLKTMQTSVDGVFAAGDIVRGASLVVWAIRDGRDAAEQMDKYISLRRQKNKKEYAA